ncbi:MAG: hypothetical protein LBH60_08265 [Prevotellaceae bacterium]|jgi:hypothetical protein|nr:hypothetical protein [Prevotellaceae bacterium]
MIDRKYITDAFSCLGEIITDYLDGSANSPAIEQATELSCIDNYWFTKENILRALDAVAKNMLDSKKLSEWISQYPFDRSGSQRTGLIMAGNIPLVGFHDMLCTLLSGNIAIIKPSSKDRRLIKTLCEILTDKFPDMTGRIIFTSGKPQNVHNVIATGSNNAARYFRAEYKNRPLLLRKNRYSTAILDGSETGSELEALADDIFCYFGLGCRNVSNVFVPENYEWNMLFDAMGKYASILNHQGYNDCFRYRKALSDLSGENYLSNGFVIIRKTGPAFPAIASINCTVYKSIEQATAFIAEQRDRIQCVVAGIQHTEDTIPFGYTQKPGLSDYADGIDTLKFLADSNPFRVE